MGSVRLLLASGILLVCLNSCSKEKDKLPKDTVWNADEMGKIVELEPIPDKELNLSLTVTEIEAEEVDEEHWCAA